MYGRGGAEVGRNNFFLARSVCSSALSVARIRAFFSSGISIHLAVYRP